MKNALDVGIYYKPTFRKNISPPSSGWRYNAREETCWTVANIGVISSTMKVDTTRLSETSVYNKPTQGHISEDGILHSHRCDSLKSYIGYLII
jgi:hypothetical protein